MTNDNPPEFPVDGSKKEIVAWVIQDQQYQIKKKYKEINWWKRAFIGQLIFWVSLFATGKIWLGWFPV